MPKSVEMNDFVIAINASGLVGSNGGGVGGAGTFFSVDEARGLSFSMSRSGKAS